MMRCQGWVGVLFAVVALLATLSSPTWASDVVWKTIALPWASAAAALTGDSTRVQHIGDENDSTRTAFVSVADWAWDDLKVPGSSSGPVNAAFVECGCLQVSAGSADTIYMSVEKRARNGRVARNATLAAAAGTVLLLQGVQQPASAVFRGVLQYDPDSQDSVNLLAPGADFRLVIKGDQSGTTPGYGGCSISITYPSRRASK